MKTLIFYLNKRIGPMSLRFWHIVSLAVIVWLGIPYLLNSLQIVASFVDIGILHVILLAFCCWLLAISLAYLMLGFLLNRIGLPSIRKMINHFKLLNLWEQYLIYLACYALLLCSAIGALMAIC